MTQVFNLDIVFYIYLAYILHCLNKFIPPNTSQYKCLTCSNTAIFPGARKKSLPGLDCADSSVRPKLRMVCFKGCQESLRVKSCI